MLEQVFDSALPLLHLSPRLAGLHGTNAHDGRITQVCFVLRLVHDVAEPGLLLAQSFQVLQDGFSCLISGPQTNIDIVPQVIAQYA